MNKLTKIFGKKLRGNIFMLLRISLLYSKTMIGPKTNPRGTPH